MNTIKKIIFSACNLLHLNPYAIETFFFFPFRLLPLQRKIVFCHFFGKAPADEPKFIFEALHKKDPTIKCIWLVQDPKCPMPDGLKGVRYGSPAAIYHWYTAKIWIDSCKATLRAPKRKGQFFLECWHGSIPLKQIEADVENILSKEYLDHAKKDSKIIDLMYSNNSFMRKLFRSRFWYSGKVIKCDEPRMAILNMGDQIRPKIEKKLDGISGKKIIVYAPTFRNDSEKKWFFWNYSSVVKACQIKFGGDFVFLIKFHPNTLCSPYCDKSLNETINASDYPDLQELMAIADVLITDYSSAMFEFGKTGKPVFLFCPDLKEYVAEDRPFYFKLNDLPFSVSETESALTKSILEFDDIKYKEKTAIFYKQINFEDHGHGNEEITNIILSKLN